MGIDLDEIVGVMGKPRKVTGPKISYKKRNVKTRQLVDRVVFDTNTPGFISKNRQYRKAGYKNVSGNGKIIWEKYK